MQMSLRVRSLQKSMLFILSDLSIPRLLALVSLRTVVKNSPLNSAKNQNFSQLLSPAEQSLTTVFPKSVFLGSGGDQKCRLENYRPEPLFRYSSKAIAFSSLQKAMAVSICHGRNLAV
jgi:hypothetical protein